MMTGELVIRKAEKRDVEGLLAIEEACFSTPWSKESLMHDVTENPLALYITAELSGRLIGYVGIWNIYDEGHINNVAVLPEYRRMHVASLLLGTLIKVTEDAGVQSHTLEVRRSNKPALALYTKFGFTVSGERKGYYDDGEDALIMWRIGDPAEHTEES